MLTSETFISIGIAAASLIVVPSAVSIVRHYLKQRALVRRAELLQTFLPRVEHDVMLENLTSTQSQQHQQNVKLFEALRTEGNVREGKILGSLESIAHVAREDSRDLSKRLSSMSVRIDDLMKMSGDRRTR